MSLTARRLTINFERNSQIVTLSGTDVSATFTFLSIFTIFNTLVERSPYFLVYFVPNREIWKDKFYCLSHVVYRSSVTFSYHWKQYHFCYFLELMIYCGSDLCGQERDIVWENHKWTIIEKFKVSWFGSFISFFLQVTSTLHFEITEESYYNNN